MKRHHFSDLLALTVVTVLGFAGFAAAGQEVPFKGNLEGDFNRTFLDPPFVLDQFDFVGDATHLGEFELFMESTVNLETRTGSASLMFIAANGDVLTARATGRGMPTGTPGVALIVQNAIITGGTGRFAGATGSFTVTQLIDSIASEAIGFFDGTISSPGTNNP